MRKYITMAIRNKDGSVYKLSSPNPLVKDQNKWDIKKEKVVLHNCIWENITISDDGVVHEHSSDFGKLGKITNAWMKLDDAEDVVVVPAPNAETVVVDYIEKPIFEENQEVIKSTQPVIVEKPLLANANKEKLVPVIKEEKPVFTVPRLKNKVLMHCLPAHTVSRQTSFYEETFFRIKYGEKFIFEAVLIDGSDLEIVFWSTDPDQRVTNHSVVYPFSWVVWHEYYKKENRVPFDEYRWWKVVEIEEKDGGWLYKASISDFQPDFSD